MGSTQRRLPESATPRRCGAEVGRHLPDRRKVQVRIVLKYAPLPDEHRLRRRVDSMDTRLPSEREPLASREFAALHAAGETHWEAALKFARRHRLEIVARHERTRELVVEGTARALNSAFGVTLRRFEHPSGSYHGHREPIRVPVELHGAIDGVLGLDSKPVLRRWGTPAPGAEPFAPAELSRYYRFPRGTTGAGQRIAVLSFGGGVHARDLTRYFSTLGVAPRVRVVTIDGANNAPLGLPVLHDVVAALNEPSATYAQLTSGFDIAVLERATQTIETTMDVQLVGALAPGASIDVVCAPNDAAGFRAAILAALGLYPVSAGGRHRRRLRRANVISISWGEAEAAWAPHQMWAVHQALKKAAHLGVSVCCSSGDYGSSCAMPGETSDEAGVSFPASSPFALACGGTTLETDGRGTIIGEVAWNAETLGMRVATGGGVSGFFRKPAYQRDLILPKPGAPDERLWLSDTLGLDEPFHGRGVPDVAANADAATGCRILVGGVETVACGTSAAAPVWAALLACLGESLGVPVGWVNPHLYRAQSRRAFHDVSRGTNDVRDRTVRYFRAHEGWDACDGLGTPRGEELLRALRGGRARNRL